MEVSLWLENGVFGNSREGGKGMGLSGGFDLTVLIMQTMRTIIQRKPDFDWRDYTCFWHELTKLPNPDSMGQI
jgi:hypothetical protein